MPDRRELIAAMRADGMGWAAIGRELGISRQAAQQLATYTPALGKRPPKKTKVARTRLLAIWRDGYTSAQFAAAIKNKTGHRYSLYSMPRIIRSIGGRLRRPGRPKRKEGGC